MFKNFKRKHWEKYNFNTY